VTIAALLIAVQKGLPYLTSHAPEALGVSMAIGALSSAGIYKLVFDGTTWLLMRVRFLKKLFFGDHFLEGTWVGFYEEPNHYCILVEVFEQSLDGTVIHGFAFAPDGLPTTKWIASAVHFKESLGSLEYLYTCEPLGSKLIEQGVAVFTVLRERVGGPATHLQGYSADLQDGHRAPSYEKKHSDKLEMPAAVLHAAADYKAMIDESRAGLKKSAAERGSA
jgi:hypothetical protein